MSSVLTLLFAPSFLIFIQYFEFTTVTLFYILLCMMTLIYALVKKKKYEDFIIVTIYLCLLSLAYFTNSLDTVKLIPVFSAITFFGIFAYGALQKKELIYKFTTRFYKRGLSNEERVFLKKGDTFWAVSILLYATLLMLLVYYGDDSLWAFFSSVGWYLYFVLTLVLHITYGKLYAIKMPLK